MGIPARKKLALEDTWDLVPMYVGSKDWAKDFEEIESSIESIAAFKDQLSQSAQILLKACECFLNLSRRIEKLFTFAHLLSDQDTTNTGNSSLKERALNLYSRFSQASSYFSPELIAIDQQKLESFLENPLLAPYRRLIKETVRYRVHTLSEPEERLLALGTEVFSSTSNVFSQLNNADLKFDSIKVDGKDFPLSHATFSIVLKNKNRDIRSLGYEKYYQEFDDHKNTLATTLSSSIKKNIFFTRAKGFPSCLERSLFSDNVDAEVYQNLLSTVSKNLSCLHDYYHFRNEKLGLEKARIFDTYVELVPEIEINVEYDEAAKLIIESLAPLGQDYTSSLESGLTANRWVDRYENIGKKSGAYSSGCYNSPPYILMNYKKESLNSLFTLAHEAGHSMHSYYSRKRQNYQDHQYTIFVAEVASTVNEMLLTEHLRKVHSSDPAMQTYLVNHQIDDIKATLHRQTMFAEFEKLTHEHGEANQSLGLDFFRGTYRNLLEKYFGSAVKIEEIDELECLRIPHFYSAFYVYKYSTGISAAISLAKGILAGDQHNVKRYLDFLGSGCSKYSIELLQDAGVDLTSPQPIQDALDFFADRLEELKTALH